MTEITPASILSLLNTTKSERASFVENVIATIKDGWNEAINVHLQVKCMEEICKQIKDHPEYKAMLMESAAKYGKSYEFHNGTIAIRNSPTRPDYSTCGDPIYNELKDALKEREKFLKGVPSTGVEIRHGDELVTVMPPTYSGGGETVFVTLK